MYSKISQQNLQAAQLWTSTVVNKELWKTLKEGKGFAGMQVEEVILNQIIIDPFIQLLHRDFHVGYAVCSYTKHCYSYIVDQFDAFQSNFIRRFTIITTKKIHTIIIISYMQRNFTFFIIKVFSMEV